LARSSGESSASNDCGGSVSSEPGRRVLGGGCTLAEVRHCSTLHRIWFSRFDVRRRSKALASKLAMFNPVDRDPKQPPRRSLMSSFHRTRLEMRMQPRLGVGSAAESFKLHPRLSDEPFLGSPSMQYHSFLHVVHGPKTAFLNEAGRMPFIAIAMGRFMQHGFTSLQDANSLSLAESIGSECHHDSSCSSEKGGSCTVCASCD
jgi:hypothetical protein